MKTLKFKWWRVQDLLIEGDALVVHNLFGEPYEPPATLFREFAKLEETPENVLAFAEKYGPLGIGERDEGGTRREPLGVWHAEAKMMRLLIHFWEQVEAPDPIALAKRLNSPENDFASLGGDSWGYMPHLPGVTRPDDGVPDYPSILYQTGDGDVYRVPWDTVEHYGPHVEVGTRVELRITKDNVLDVVDRCRTGLEQRLTTALQWGVKHIYSRNLGLALEATNLRGFLWLQFALAVDGNKQYGRCKECGELYEKKKRGSRVEREYCGDACRQRARRKRRRNAVAAVVDDQPIEEVATSFGIDLDKLKEWVETDTKKKSAKKKPAKRARPRRGKGGSNA